MDCDWPVDDDSQGATAQRQRRDCSSQDGYESHMNLGHTGIRRYANVRKCVSQKPAGTHRLLFHDGSGGDEGGGDGAGRNPRMLADASRSTGASEKLGMVDGDVEFAPVPAPQHRLLRSQSQLCPSTRRSRGFRSEETGEHLRAEPLTKQHLQLFQRQLQRQAHGNTAFESTSKTLGSSKQPQKLCPGPQRKDDPERLQMPLSAFMFPSARRITCEGSAQGSGMCPGSCAGDTADMTGGVVPLSPSNHFHKGEESPVLPLGDRDNRGPLGRKLPIIYLSSDSDSESDGNCSRGPSITGMKLVMTPRSHDRGYRRGTAGGASQLQSTSSGGGKSVVLPPVEVNAKAALSRRRSEHGTTHRVRLQNERRRASCWTANDADGHCEYGDDDSTDRDNGGGPGCSEDSNYESDDGDDLPLVGAPGPRTEGRRSLCPPSVACAVAAKVVVPGSSGGTSNPSSPAGQSLFMSAPTAMATTPGGRTGLSSHSTLLLASYQDMQWPPVEPYSSGGRAPLNRILSLRRDAVSPQPPEEEQSGAAGMLPPTGSIGSSCCAADDESQCLHVGGAASGGGGAGCSSSGCGGTPRTSFDMLGDDAAAVRQAALRGWSSRGLLVRGSGDQRRSVMWLNGGSAVDPSPQKPPQKHEWQDQQVVCAPSPPKILKPLFRVPPGASGALDGGTPGLEPTGGSTLLRAVYGSAAESEDGSSMSGGEEAANARRSATALCMGTAEADLRSPRHLPRLLQPVSSRPLQDFACVPWQLRAKSSSALRVPWAVECAEDVHTICPYLTVIRPFGRPDR